MFNIPTHMFTKINDFLKIYHVLEGSLQWSCYLRWVYSSQMSLQVCVIIIIKIIITIAILSFHHGRPLPPHHYQDGRGSNVDG